MKRPPRRRRPPETIYFEHRPEAPDPSADAPPEAQATEAQTTGAPGRLVITPKPAFGPRTVPGWRAWQLSALLFALLALAGYWAMTSTVGQQERLSLVVPGAAPHFTLLLAGRDIVYCYYRTPCADQNQRTKLYQPPNTDTIMLIKVDGTRVDVLSIPRDTNVGPYNPALGSAYQKVNSQWFRGGPDALAQAVEQITGTHVDYSMVVRTDYVAAVIDALGGLDVTVPDIPGYEGGRGLQFDDEAAGLHVHLSPGQHHLGGKDAVSYLRMRKGFGDDYGRIDHQKQALTQLLGKLRGAGPGAMVTIVRGLTSGSVDTNLDIALIPQLTPYLHTFQVNFATLPTAEIPGTTNLAVDTAALSQLWGTPISAASTVQSAGIRVFDGSGDGLGAPLRGLLTRLGYQVLSLQEETPSGESSQVFTLDRTGEADKLADLLQLPRLQGLRFSIASGEVGLYLGQDAARQYAVLGQLPALKTLPVSGTSTPTSTTSTSEQP